MQSAVKYVGVITTDARLVVHGWDQWLVEATGLTEEDVIGRQLDELFPEINERGIPARLQRVLDDGVVEVLAPAFHQYFIRCPAPGALPHFDVMQQHVSISPLRDASGVAGLIVTIEDVTARRVRERELAAQLKNQDETIRLRAARILSEEADHAEPLLGALSDSSWQVRQAAVRGVSRTVDDDVLARLVETVRDHHTDIGRLNAALSALTSSSVDPIPHLTPLLASEHADVRTYTALTLGNLRDARATPALLRLLDDTNANVRFHAIEALGRIGSRSALLPLLHVAETRDPFLSFAALDALAEIGEPSVAPTVERLLPSPDLSESAATALAAVGDERSAAAVARALRDKLISPIAAARALAAIHERVQDTYGESQLVPDMVRPELSPDAAAQLADSMGDANDADLVAIATVIGWLEFEGVDSTLARLLQHPEVRRVAVDALVARGVRSTQVLVRELASPDGDVRRAAALALGRIGDFKATPGLLALLDDEEPATIITAAGALGAIGNAGAFHGLLAILTHTNPAVRHAAVSAINSIGHPDTEKEALALVQADDERLRESGARIAGYFGYASCLEGLIGLTADSSTHVRRTAVEHLGFFDDERVLPALTYALKDDNPVVRAAASRALAHAEHAGVIAVLGEALSDPDARVRYQAVQSVSAQRLTELSETLQTIVQKDDAIPVRIAAVGALGRFRDASATPVLTELAAHPEFDLASAALDALGDITTPDACATLERALTFSEPRLHLAALDAIARHHAPKLLPELQRIASTTVSPQVAESAIRILAQHGHDAEIDALIEMTMDAKRRAFVIEALTDADEARVPRIALGLQHADANVRLAMVESLARMKRPAASRALGRALQDPDPIVRFATVQALGRLDLAERGRAV